MDTVTADCNIILCQYIMTSSLRLFLHQLIRDELSTNLSVRKLQCESQVNLHCNRNKNYKVSLLR